MTKIDESRCTGCGICVNICPDGIEMAGGKAKIKDENAKCLKDAADSCPRGAIVLDGEGAVSSREGVNTYGSGRGMGQGQGRGVGAGRGRGLGMGPRDGRGRGQGGGGRRR